MSDHTGAYGGEEGRLHVAAYGRVQGVGFRDFVRRQARRLGDVRGWVRNRADGSVEIVAAGDAERLAELRARVSAGPPWAHVTRVEELPPVQETLPAVFEIRS